MSAVTSTVRLPLNEAKWVFLLKSPIPFEKDPSLWKSYDFFDAMRRWRHALKKSLVRDNIVKDAVTITVSIALSADDTMDLIIEFIVAGAKDERSTLFVRAAKKWCRIVTKMACNWRPIIVSTKNTEYFFLPPWGMSLLRHRAVLLMTNPTPEEGDDYLRAGSIVNWHKAVNNAKLDVNDFNCIVDIIPVATPPGKNDGIQEALRGTDVDVLLAAYAPLKDLIRLLARDKTRPLAIAGEVAWTLARRHIFGDSKDRQTKAAPLCAWDNAIKNSTVNFDDQSFKQFHAVPRYESIYASLVVRVVMKMWHPSGTNTHQDGDDRRETVVALNRIASAPPIIVSSTALDAAKEPSV